jgi:hypothetical protein
MKNLTSIFSLRVNSITFLLTLVPFFINAQTTLTFIISGSFTVPVNVTSIFVEAWGAGGSGGGAVGSSNPQYRAMGGGGGGGAYNSGNISVTPGDVINYTVAGQTDRATTTPINGGTSSFGAIAANGGTGGQCVNAGSSGSHVGGLGGDGGIGQINGGNGGDRNGYDGSNPGAWTSPGGGGGAGNVGQGGSASDQISTPSGGTGGTGNGTGVGGAGGDGRTSSGNLGDNGFVTGGGGGGAWAAASSNVQGGGRGARGQIRITYTASTPLSTELIDLSIKVIKASWNKINWQTASEINNAHFSIERSSNGIAYLEIGAVSGHGTTNETINYEFIDKSPFSGTNYYRLKQFDFDGKFDYSKVISVIFVNKNGVQLYPTIVNQEVWLKLDKATDESGSIQIYNINGQLKKTAHMRLKQLTFQFLPMNYQQGNT